MSKSGWTIFPSLNVRATIMESGRASSKDSFTASRQTSWIYI
jgi:hypothetical protein